MSTLRATTGSPRSPAALNRWVTLSGKTPELRILHFDDPRIGYLEGQTIFDVLTKYGISWRIYESDLSLIRTFNRYRLDAQNVQPFYNRYDHQQSFEWICKTGQLPSVTFVEPNFTDIPPLSTANDDLAPTDIHRGQLFLARVVQAVRSAPTWDKTLMLITYDEHGGFYDHVPPPGTPKGPDEWKGRVPALHPSTDPPTNFMGVRVPAIVVSPFVRPGGVCKQVFDHTSIIKTILLRWSDRFPSSVHAIRPRVGRGSGAGAHRASSSCADRRRLRVQSTAARDAAACNRRFTQSCAVVSFRGQARRRAKATLGGRCCA